MSQKTATVTIKRASALSQSFIGQVVGETSLGVYIQNWNNKEEKRPLNGYGPEWFPFNSKSVNVSLS